MTEFLLDTNAISHAVRFPQGLVATRLRASSGKVFTSVIVESELRFGITPKPETVIATRVAQLLDALPIAQLDSLSAAHYADIRHVLESRGTPLDAMDLLIAAHARSLGSCLVTDNTSHFERVPALMIQNWQRDAPPKES